MVNLWPAPHHRSTVHVSRSVSRAARTFSAPPIMRWYRPDGSHLSPRGWNIGNNECILYVPMDPNTSWEGTRLTPQIIPQSHFLRRYGRIHRVFIYNYLNKIYYFIWLYLYMYISIEECVYIYILMNQHTTIGIRLKGPTKIRII